MIIEMPHQVKQIIKIFEQSGYDAYAVGGCIRDSILGKNPSDWDITTNALPNHTIECFKAYKIIKTGLQHGTVTIIVDSEHLEVTTFRIDGIYSDNRRPDNVEFTENLKQDLSRRDFTINAMAYNSKAGLIDFFGGKKDIKNKIIKCVGEPDLRFNEDALRIMRALRFASVLGFQLDPLLVSSIHKNRPLLDNIAVERISAELNKLLLGCNVKQVLSDFVDIIIQFIPELKPMIDFEQNNPYHHLDVWKHTVESVDNSPCEIILRLTMLFHDIGKPISYIEDETGAGHFYGHAYRSADIATCILKRLKYDNATISVVHELIFYHDYSIQPRKKLVKRLLNTLGLERTKQLLEVKKADIKAHNTKYISDTDNIDNIDKVYSLIDEIIEQRQCFCLKDLAVNGKDLIDLGIPKGVQIGCTLNKLMNMVINDEIENNREKLLDEALLCYNNLVFCQNVV